MIRKRNLWIFFIPLFFLSLSLSLSLSHTNSLSLSPIQTSSLSHTHTFTLPPFQSLSLSHFRSLVTIEDVINKLSTPSTIALAPFRTSKLTHYLRYLKPAQNLTIFFRTPKCVTVANNQKYNGKLVSVTVTYFLLTNFNIIQN